MQLKNNMNYPFKAVVATNIGETIDRYDIEGKVVGKKPAPRKLTTIHIGPKATAEIEDSYWHQLWESKGKGAGEVEEVVEEHLKLKGEGDKPLQVRRKEAVTMKTVYTYRRMVEKGAIEIIEPAKPKQTQEEMVDMIREALGLEDWKPKDPEHLEEMFYKVVG